MSDLDSAPPSDAQRLLDGQAHIYRRLDPIEKRLQRLERVLYVAAGVGMFWLWRHW